MQAVWKVWAPSPELQKWERTEERESSREQIRSVGKPSDAVRSERGEKARSSEGCSEMF